MELARAISIGVIAVVIIGIGFFLLGSGNSVTGLFAGKQSASQQETVRLGYVPGPFSAIPIVAMRKGYFADEGLKVEEVRAGFVAYIFPQLIDGKVDVLAGGETPAVFMALKGSKFKIMGKLTVLNDDLTVIARANSGIASIKDLSGKKVGLPFTSVAQYNLFQKLKENGVDPHSVVLVDLGPQNMASALSHGDVDAIYVWEPTPSKIISGFGNTVTSFTLGSKWFFGAYVSQDFDKKTAAKQKVMNAFLRAEKFIKENPEEAKQIVSKDISLDAETMSKFWGKMSFEVGEFDDVPLLEKEAKWAIDENLTAAKAIPNFGDYVEPFAR